MARGTPWHTRLRQTRIPASRCRLAAPAALLLLTRIFLQVTRTALAHSHGQHVGRYLPSKGKETFLRGT